MKKLQKRYYILIVVIAIAAGAFLISAEKNSFRIVKNSTAYAPELDVVMAADSEDTDKKININTASVYELEKLYGIGEGFAKRIIDYRTKNGKFEVIQDIMKVSGIGEKIFEGIKNNICVE